MRPATLIPVEEYLTTSYEVDCDYVEGELVERNVGERDHGSLQGAIYARFFAGRRESGVYPFLEQRIQISARRFRVADVCLVVGQPVEQIFTKPPLVVIEILSPEDRMSRMLARIGDYLDFGVRYVWVIDSVSRRTHAYTQQGSHEVKDGILRTENPDIELRLDEIFRELD